MEQLPVETTLYSLADAPPAEPAERREGERHLTLLRVGSMIIGGRRELCLIKNISAGGMMIRAYCPVKIGTRMEIELKCGQPVAGTVRWIKGETIGVSFDTPVDVVELLTLSMEGRRPRMPRVEVECTAWVRQGALSHRVRACDVSQGGIKVATAATLSIGGEVMVTLPGLEPQPGTVRWHEDGSYGITFNRVLALATLVAWIHERRERMRAAG